LKPVSSRQIDTNIQEDKRNEDSMYVAADENSGALVASIGFKLSNLRR
jgi:hypothetical protein